MSSNSYIKLKKHEIFEYENFFNLHSSKYQTLTNDDFIVDSIFAKTDNPAVLSVLSILSKGSLISFEYDQSRKRSRNFSVNSSLSSFITNTIEQADLAFSLPFILVTSLNEIIFIASATDMSGASINIKEENLMYLYNEHFVCLLRLQYFRSPTELRSQHSSRRHFFANFSRSLTSCTE